MKRLQGFRPTTIFVAAVISASACGDGDRGDVTAASKAPLMLGGASPGRSDQFVRGTDSMLYRRYSEAAYQYGYQYLGNRGVALVSDPAVASWGAGRADVFVINANNTI